MPHIIVEYASQLSDSTNLDTVLKTIHQAIANSGLFEASHIKTRAYPFHNYTNAGGDKPYIHIQARIKSGRSTDNKKQLAEAIIADLQPLDIPAAVITVEVIDMERDSYAKLSNNSH